MTTHKYDIKNNKEDYYKYRDFVNSNIDSDMYGIYLYFLFNSCINSMARFGPNGFNQSYGKRYKCLSESEFDLIKSRINRAIIYNMDFFELYIPNNSLLFLDPPYIERPVSYDTISNDSFNNLMRFIENTESDVIYTDIDHDRIKLTKVTLRDEMRNTAPLSNKEVLNKEVLFYKIT